MLSDVMASCPPVSSHSLVWPPAEPFFRPDPHDGAAVARSGGQGRPSWGRPEGLSLTVASASVCVLNRQRASSCADRKGERPWRVCAKTFPQLDAQPLVDHQSAALFHRDRQLFRRPAVVGLWPQNGATAGAVVEELACIRGHRLDFDVSALGTCNRRVENDLRHRHIPGKTARHRPPGRQ